MNRSQVLGSLREQGWMIEEGLAQRFTLPPALATRYPRLPDEWVEFVSGLVSCVDASQKSWFLCSPDFCGTSGSAFAWNEWELISIEAARGDQDYLKTVTRFWDVHLPILMSVRSGYAYHALCLEHDRFGEVVEGREPMFEECDTVAKSLTDFLSRYLRRS